MTASITRDLIIEKLSTVYDPEIPVNIWELGLIYDIEFPKPSEVIIHMTPRLPDARSPMRSCSKCMMW